MDQQQSQKPRKKRVMRPLDERIASALGRYLEDETTLGQAIGHLSTEQKVRFCAIFSAVGKVVAQDFRKEVEARAARAQQQAQEDAALLQELGG